jgi:hypothetical protein
MNQMSDASGNTDPYEPERRLVRPIGSQIMSLRTVRQDHQATQAIKLLVDRCQMLPKNFGDTRDPS